MVDPISNLGGRPVGPLQPTRPVAAPSKGKDASDFAAALRAQLEQVSQMQQEANAGVEKLMTGETENITEVFTAARKADVAFSLLMEIRNKLSDAYIELRQIRV